ncbi:hypothetical protein Tco_0839934 [Tanacetum coccineum]|uniref:Uncharacterized protein n=1 Tax=Tanacetum coccineum TaxID=301880 RepID=A0ABQ5AV55_9ASTR
MPRILILLRPILGVLQIGIRSQDTNHSSDTRALDGVHPHHAFRGRLANGSPGVDPVYPEFLPGDDEVFPAEEQPLPAADSPTHQSPGYIPESDPEEDLEEDDEEDPERIQPTIPADIGKMMNKEQWMMHISSAEPAAPTPFLSEEVAERLLALPNPPPSPLSPYSSPLPHIPFPPLPISSPPPISPTYVEGSMGSRAAGIRQRDALPVHETEMPEMCLSLRKRPCRTTPGPGCEDEESSAAGAARQFGPTIARADLYGFTDMKYTDTQRGPPESYRVVFFWYDQEDEIIYSQLDDARYDRALLRARVNRLDSDRPFHRRTALLIEEEARLSRAAWAQSMDACDQYYSEGAYHCGLQSFSREQSEITELQQRTVEAAVITDSAESRLSEAEAI